MDLHHILAAADESEAGHQAVRSAIDLAARVRADVTVMRAVPVGAMAVAAGAADVSDFAGVGIERPSVQDLHQWIRTELHAQREPPHVEVGIAAGVPAIEICRLAERRQADLLVLGRKQRSQLGRLLLGDTADAVARRSEIPCLFVPPNSGPFRQVLVALDGSERGMLVLRGALGFALGAGASLRMMTVEAGPPGERDERGFTLPAARSARLESELQALLAQKPVPGAVPTVHVRRGEIVEQILATVHATGADVLVIGYHRGGLPGIIEAGSTSRRVVHTAPCAVLTIPL
jgi:nucleotide-binding universal stress UspA family protein